MLQSYMLISLQWNKSDQGIFLGGLLSACKPGNISASKQKELDEVLFIASRIH